MDWDSFFLGLARPSWLGTAWLLVPPMRQLGDEAEAARILDSLVRAIRRHGLREYYDPLTGRGLGVRRFAMSALIVDLWPAKPGRPSTSASTGA